MFDSHTSPSPLSQPSLQSILTKSMQSRCTAARARDSLVHAIWEVTGWVCLKTIIKYANNFNYVTIDSILSLKQEYYLSRGNCSYFSSHMNFYVPEYKSYFENTLVCSRLLLVCTRLLLVCTRQLLGCSSRIDLIIAHLLMHDCGKTNYFPWHAMWHIQSFLKSILAFLFFTTPLCIIYVNIP